MVVSLVDKKAALTVHKKDFLLVGQMEAQLVEKKVE